jgi:glycosyltransferase involved in cell wall biosynthesis
MNILFILYDGFHSNSANFAVGYANALAADGQNVAIAVPTDVNGAIEVPTNARFQCVSHEQVIRGFSFANGKAPDVVHAWTPRENVRKTAFGCVAMTRAKLVVHLEDHEDHITSTILAQTAEELSELSELELARILPQKLSHPRLADLFIRMADAVTVVWPSLNDFVPQQIPKHHLRMCPDPARLSGCISPAEMAAKLGVHTNENLIVYSGHLNSVNRADQSALYEAIVLLNSQGVSCRLIRTGPNTQGIAESLAVGSAPYVVEAGLLSEEELAATMRLATVFVQPGRNDVFNRYRMPCKVGEFLSLGIPVVLPKANIAEWMVEGEHALFLHNGSSEEIACKCRQLFNSSSLRQKLACSGKAFASQHLDLEQNASELLTFYKSLSERIQPKHWSVSTGDPELEFMACVLETFLSRHDLEGARLISRQLRFGPPCQRKRPLTSRDRWLHIARLFQSEIVTLFKATR